MLHLLAGIDDFDQGRIRFIQTTSAKAVEFWQMKETAKTKFRRANIGMVFQQQCLLPDLTVYENIMLPVMLEGSKKEKIPQRISYYIYASIRNYKISFLQFLDRNGNGYCAAACLYVFGYMCHNKKT